MTPFLQMSFAERQLGCALHYPLLHSAIVGLAAKRTLEFGAGGSTRVFLEALAPGSAHLSFSTETRAQLETRHGISTELPVEWLHFHGQSEMNRWGGVGDLDLILHDGSHAANVVASDIAWSWPRLKTFGLLLVHDVQHSYCGAEVREGVRQGLAAARACYTATTLPYGFGLTVIRREDAGCAGMVKPAQAKVGSAHMTELVEFRP